MLTNEATIWLGGTVFAFTWMRTAKGSEVFGRLNKHGKGIGRTGWWRTDDEHKAAKLALQVYSLDNADDSDARHALAAMENRS